MFEKGSPPKTFRKVYGLILNFVQNVTCSYRNFQNDRRPKLAKSVHSFVALFLFTLFASLKNHCFLKKNKNKNL